jgi:hypothetical protein
VVMHAQLVEVVKYQQATQESLLNQSREASKAWWQP